MIEHTAAPQALVLPRSFAPPPHPTPRNRLFRTRAHFFFYTTFIYTAHDLKVDTDSGAAGITGNETPPAKGPRVAQLTSARVGRADGDGPSRQHGGPGINRINTSGSDCCAYELVCLTC